MNTTPLTKTTKQQAKGQVKGEVKRQAKKYPTQVPAYFLAAYECAVLRDAAVGDTHSSETYDPQAALHAYFNDLFQVFVGKVASIPVETSFTSQQEQRMQEMLTELLKVKRMLNGSLEEPI